MKVDERNRQPIRIPEWWCFSGTWPRMWQASAPWLCAQGQIAVGINVSGTHVLAVSEGDTVTAYAKLVHKGRTLHTWEVAIKKHC